MRRADIRATVVRLQRTRPELVPPLEAILQSRPVPKPSGFTGGEETDFFYLDLSDSDLEEITDAVADLEISRAQDDEPTPELSFVSQLHDRWRNADSSRPAV